jgi:hypothetical protein
MNDLLIEYKIALLQVAVETAASFKESYQARYVKDNTNSLIIATLCHLCPSLATA